MTRSGCKRARSCSNFNEESSGQYPGTPPLITSISGYVGLLLGIGILEAYGPSLDKYFITDPRVSTNLVAMATLALIISGFIAAYVPAKRASQIKPIIALRDE